MEQALKGNGLEVRLERRIAASAGKVWQIISTTEGMNRWLGTRTFEAKAGGRVLLDVLHDGTRWLMFGCVRELVNMQRVSFSWQEFNTATLSCWPEPTLVTITIEEQGDGCLVQLVHSGFEALPDSIAEHEGYRQGWTSRDVLADLASKAEQA